MNGKAEDWDFLEEALELSSYCPALDTDQVDLYTDLFGVPEQTDSEESLEPWNNEAAAVDSSDLSNDLEESSELWNNGALTVDSSDFGIDPEESPEPWNNGSPAFDFSGFGIDPQLECPVGAVTNSPAQVVSDQGVARVGSVDGSQVAILAP